VLARMHRGYTAARYLERLAAARDAVPDLAVSTDIIVGFPGETDDDFELTLAVAREAAYDSAYTFIFSPRPGTEAAEMTADFVDADVCRQRMDRLVEVVEASAGAAHEARVGRTERVLVDGPSKKDPAVWAGRTTQNKLTHFARTDGVAAGADIDVRITRAAPHWLQGEVVTTYPRARRVRARIPLTVV
jgi:tRNA-2-methylthio-N6-dimethylallyladenosine synthase